MLYCEHQEVKEVLARFIFWIKRNRKTRSCGGCCVICRYYDMCRCDKLEN